MWWAGGWSFRRLRSRLWLWIGLFVMFSMMFSMGGMSGAFSPWVFIFIVWLIWSGISRWQRAEFRPAQTTKRKNDEWLDEKPKRGELADENGTQYMLGDDGELIEVDRSRKRAQIL
jgi:hypothetical protein